MQHVVGAVDRDQPEHVVAVEDADQRDQPIRRTERDGDGLGRIPARGRDQQQRAGREMNEVVQAVDLEAEQRTAVDAIAELEARVGDEPGEAGDSPTMP